MHEETDILRLLWSRRKGIEGEIFHLCGGGDVRIERCGDPAPDGKIFRAAQLDINGTLHRGDVFFGHATTIPSPYSVLQVTGAPSDPVLDSEGRRISQLVLKIPPQTVRSLRSLRQGAGSYECGLWLADLSPVQRISIIDDLLIERLRRKCGDIMEIFAATENNWGQTLHVMLLRTMGGNRNREPYMRLASLADYSMVMRERSSSKMVEALLLGTSGLLDGIYFDDYIHELREHFSYLRNKYRISPMLPDEWERAGLNPRNNPVLRIVQLASFLVCNDFVFDTVMKCRTREDVHRLFSAEASDYWTTHYVPDSNSDRCPKRIGMDKADLLGINLVAPMMFAFGDYSARESLKEAAMELLGDIPCESNTIVRGWSGMGVPVSSALDSQALLQLKNEYCAAGRCTVCRIGRRIIKSADDTFTFQ